MGLKDRLRKLEHSAEGGTVLAVCLECGEKQRIREGILLDLVALDWQMHQDGAEELPADTPSDVRWVWEHPCDALELRDKFTGESIFGAVWEQGTRAMRAREDGA